MNDRGCNNYYRRTNTMPINIVPVSKYPYFFFDIYTQCCANIIS